MRLRQLFPLVGRPGRREGILEEEGRGGATGGEVGVSVALARALGCSWAKARMGDEWERGGY